MKRISTLRETYPLVSVADRLEYETEPRAIGVNAVADAGTAQLNSVVEQRLAAMEQRLTERRQYYSRRQILAALHTQTNDEFVEASGFGRRRIIDPGAERYAEKLALPDLGPIPRRELTQIPPLR